MSTPSTAAERLARYSVSPGRRRKDTIARTFIQACTVIALIPLLLILYYLLQKGPELLSVSFFTTDPRATPSSEPPASAGSSSALARHAWRSSALASVISIPIGVGVALWLVEYGKKSAFARVVRFFVDILTGVPSIVFGLFIYMSSSSAPAAATRATRVRSRSCC